MSEWEVAVAAASKIKYGSKHYSVTVKEAIEDSLEEIEVVIAQG